MVHVDFELYGFLYNGNQFGAGAGIAFDQLILAAAKKSSGRRERQIRSRVCRMTCIFHVY